MNLPPDLIRRVDGKVIETYLLAEKLYGRHFELPTIVWDLRGLCAGRAQWPSNRIRLNPIFLTENPEAFIRQTVPHEIAHLVNRSLFGAAVKSHGPEWKNVMRGFGLEPLRCHNYVVTHSSFRKQRRHHYFCSCRSHLISQVMHNRIRSGSVYSCRNCGVPLQVREDQRG
mgnify:CR=1 FL=1